MERVQAMTINKTDLLVKAQELRKALGEDDDSPMDIFALVLSIEKLTLVRYPMGERLSGMCIKNEKGNVLAINSGMTLGRQRFSLAHELYHLYYDEKMTAICEVTIGSGNDIEKSADQFASYFLIPPVSLKSKIAKLRAGSHIKELGVNEIVRLEQYYGVSRQAMLTRLIDDRTIKPANADAMRTNVIRSASSLGYSSELYSPLPEEKQYQTFGYLIEQANIALDKGLISDGKYEEMLLQAFRSDIVYGEDDGGGEIVD